MLDPLVYNYMAVILFLGFFYIGVTFALFQSRGTSPIYILPLEISHNGEAIDEATSPLRNFNCLYQELYLVSFLKVFLALLLL